jgi:hypothetical protein
MWAPFNGCYCTRMVLKMSHKCIFLQIHTVAIMPPQPQCRVTEYAGRQPEYVYILCSQGQCIKMERKRYSTRLSLEVVQTLPMPAANPKLKTMNLIRYLLKQQKQKSQTTWRHIGGTTYASLVESIKFLNVLFLTYEHILYFLGCPKKHLHHFLQHCLSGACKFTHWDQYQKRKMLR